MSLVTKQGFEPDHREFGLHIRSEIARRPPMQVARKIARIANATAPFAPKKKGDRRRRHLKGSFVARPDGVLRVGRNTRTVAVVESTVREAAPNEFGGPGQDPQHTLRSAAFVVLGTEPGLGEFRVERTNWEGGK